MKVSKGSVMSVVFMAILTLLVGSSIGQAGPMIIDMGSTATPQHSYSRTVPSMIAEVEKASGGQIKLTASFGGVHGSEREMSEAVQLGNLKMGWISDIGMASVVPGIAYVNLPYLLPSYGDVEKYYFNGFLGEEMQKRLLTKGIRLLGWLENDYRDLTNSRRPVTKEEDIRGLKIRVPEFPMLLSFFRKLGAYPTPMAVTELLTALQQKTIDGQDNGIILTYSFGFYQTQKYFTTTHHSYSGGAIVISENFWNTLTPDQQKILQAAARRAGDSQRKLNRADVAGFKKKMEEGGIQFSELTPEARAKFKVVASQVWSEFKDKFGADLRDRIQKELGK
jgi:tripartite ATP-independent transporter DctP family solute receptor